MNRTLKASGLAVALGVAGCGAEGSQPPASVARVNASIEKSYDHLRALQVFSADRLVMNLPAEATACYGAPCDPEKWQGPIDAERARQAPRLAALAEFTEA